MSIYNGSTGLRWLRKYFKGRGRYTFLGPGSWAGWTAILHTAVEQFFKIGEHGKLDFVAESFNALNHTNVALNQFYGPETSSIPVFATPNKAGIPRQLQFSIDFESDEFAVYNNSGKTLEVESYNFASTPSPFSVLGRIHQNGCLFPVSRLCGDVIAI